MASSNPFISPYTAKMTRIPLTGNMTNRLAAATKDQIFYNVIAETSKDEIAGTKKTWINKRGGFTAETTVVGGGGEGRALYYWPATSKTYAIIGDKLYANTSSIKTLATSTGTCWITEYITSAGTQRLIVGDGVDMYTVNTSDTVTEITDADMPSTQITPVFFDSYIFIIKASTPQIWNSNVDDPTAWSAIDFTSAEMYPDNLIALARQVNYLVGLGPYSIEFYYDAANATGSPVRRQDTISIKVGLAARESVSQVDKRIIFVGQVQTGDPSVWMIEGLQPHEIGNEYIRRILTNEGSSLANAKSWICTHRGHTLYILNLSSRTIVYDCEDKFWVDWSTNSSSAHAVLPYNFGTQGANNKILVLHNTDGKIYRLDPAVHTDDAGAILVSITTDRIDLNTNNYKQQLGVTLLSDIQSSGSVTIDWSDDDYTTWSSSRTLSLTSGRAYTKAGGVFRRRAYRLQHSTNTAFRAEALELDYQLRTT